MCITLFAVLECFLVWIAVKSFRTKTKLLQKVRNIRIEENKPGNVHCNGIMRNLSHITRYMDKSLRNVFELSSQFCQMMYCEVGESVFTEPPALKDNDY